MARSGVSAPAATVVLRLPASPAHVRTARLVAAAMARRSGVDETMLDEVRLAVGEACARAVRQHERFSLAEPITLEFGDTGRFSVAVIDRAPSAGTTPPSSARAANSTPSAGSPPAVAQADAAPAAVAPGSAPADPGSAPVGPGSTSSDPSSVADPGAVAGGPGSAAAGAGSAVAAPAVADLQSMIAGEGEEPGWQSLAATADALGLALLDAVAQEVVVTEADVGTGTCITMSWPLGD